MNAEHEFSVLFPDRDVTVRDPETGAEVSLAVREFRFREGLEATALARPLIAALAALVPESDGGASTREEGPDALAIDSALAANAAIWLELTARACSRDADWLARLGDGDGRALSEAMWGANGGFFLRRVVAQVASRGRGASPSRSPACSTPSSAPATAAATSTSAST